MTPLGLLSIVAGHSTVALELLDLLDEVGEKGIEATQSGLWGCVLASLAVVAGNLDPHTLVVD